MFDFFRNRRRRRIAAEAFPEGWEACLRAGFPLFNKLPESLQAKLRKEVQIFIAEKNFEGIGGFEVTDEMRVLIAAQACLLLLGNEHRAFDRLKTVLIHPETYRATSQSSVGQHVVFEQDQAVLGQSWDVGVVSLSWRATEQGAGNPFDGANVVIHEFAHQLDQEDGVANGVPVLRSRGRYAAWQQVLSREYERLKEDVDSGRRTVMDEYGATHPAEFFAVASECFFEKPEQLKKNRPELYRELQTFYGQDPIEYF
jgi:Mlc titration factor MtfA (ptsG expression regulator)